MALDIFKLVGSIFINTDEADKSMKKTEKTAGNLAGNIGKAVGVVAGVGTAVVGAVGTASTAMIALANDAASTADEVDKASIRMGVSYESYQELAYAAGQCGVEMTTMEKAAKKLEGTDISFDDAMESIMGMATAEERAAKASELFGTKVAYELSPLIEQSQGDYDGLIERAHELGLVMGDDAVKNGVAFGDLMSDLKQAAKMLATNLGSSLFPILNQLIEYIISYMPQVQAMVDQFAPTITSMLDTVLPLLLSVAEQVLPVLFSTLNSLFPMLVDVVTTALPVAIDLIVQLLPLALQIVQSVLPLAVTLLDSLMPLISSLLPLLPPIVNLLVQIITPLVELLTQILPPIIDTVTMFVDFLVPLLIEGIGNLTEMASMFVSDFASSLKGMLDGIIQAFKGLINFIVGVFTGDWKKALGGLIDIGKGIINTLIGYVEGAINSLISGINLFATGIKDVLNGIPGVDIQGKFEMNKLKIPRLEKGGTLTSSGTVLVGERGPEFLNLPTGATVTPLSKAGNIDYEKMTQCFIQALREVAPELQSNVEISANEKQMFNVVRKQSQIYKKSTGSPAFS